MKENTDSIKKFLKALDDATDCITDMKLQIQYQLEFKSNEDILEEMTETHNFLMEAEEHFKVSIKK